MAGANRSCWIRTTFSLVNYQEADKVLADWKSLAAAAEEIYQELPERERATPSSSWCFIRSKPAHRSMTCTSRRQKAVCTPARGAPARMIMRRRRARCSKPMRDLSAYYNHTLADGKWDHMMDQTHIGYTYWQQPPTNIMPAVGGN